MTYTWRLWTLFALVALTLALIAWWAYGAWEESRKANSRLDAIAHDQRGMRLQVATILTMLRRAGFKKGPVVDWSDDTTKTQVLDKNSPPSWWRKK